MTNGFTMRFATVADIPVIAHHRNAMFADMGSGTPESRALMDTRFPGWVRGRIESGEYIGFLIEDASGAVVAGAGLWLVSWPTNPADGTETLPYILNVYTEPDCRGKGLARRLMTGILDWLRERGMKKAALHASKAGRHLYTTLGFEPSNEMRYMFPSERS